MCILLLYSNECPRDNTLSSLPPPLPPDLLPDHKNSPPDKHQLDHVRFKVFNKIAIHLFSTINFFPQHISQENNGSSSSITYSPMRTR